MSHQAKELFRVNVSRGSAADNPSTASVTAHSSFKGGSTSPWPSSLAAGSEAQGNLTEKTLPRTPSGAALLHESQRQKKDQQNHHHHQQPNVRTAPNSSVLSLRVESPSFVMSRPHTPPRIRPTSELPPTRDATSVLRGMPTALKASDDTLHDVPARPPQAPAQPRGLDALHTIDTSTHETRAASQPAVPVSSTVAVMGEEKTVRSTICRVCSLCGISVVLVGTFVEHQQQWNEHVDSWAHQRNVQLRALARREDFISMESTDVASSPPLSQGMIRTLGEISASPVLLQKEEASAMAISPLRAIFFPHRADGIQADEDIFLPHEKRRGNVSPTAAPSHVFKELFDEENLAATPDAKSNEEDHVDICRNEERPDALLKVGSRRRRKAMLRDKRGGESSRLAERTSEVVSVNERGLSRVKKIPHTDYAASSEHSGSASPRRERQLECTLAKFLIQKEGRQLLACFRRWFNFVLVRMMSDSSLLIRTSSKRGPAAAADLVEEAFSTVSAKPKCGEESLLHSSAVTLEKREDAALPAASSHIENDQQREDQRLNKTATGDGEREGPFMASRVKYFAHVVGSSSSSSVEMEMARTDVSWYVHRTVRPLHRGSGGGSGEGLRTSPWESDTSIEEMLSTLTPDLQERVRAVLSGEPERSRAFPKTSEALNTIRYPSLGPNLSPGGPRVLDTDGNHSISSSFPMAHVTRSGSGEVMQGIIDPQKGSSSSLSTHAGPIGRRPTGGDAKPGNQEVPILMDVEALNFPSPPAELSGMPPLRQEEPLGHLSGETAPVEVRDSPSYLRRQKSLEGYQKASSEEKPSPSSPSKICDFIGQDGDQKADSAPHGSFFSQPSVPRQRRGEQEGSPSWRQAWREELDVGKGGANEEFKGIPGEYYCYYKDAYHRVLDPTCEEYYDARGRRLPIFFVRRSTRTRAFSARRLIATTRPKSPLGPGRLNPYCSVCVARYFLIVVDEYMRPITVTPRRQRGASGGNGEAHTCVCPGRSARPSPSRGMREAFTRKKALQSPRRTSSWERQDSSFPSPLPHSFPLAMKSDSTGATTSGHASASPQLVSAAPLGDSKAPETSQDPVPEENKRLRRLERDLRRRVKSLLWRELPQCRGSQQWVDYLTSLKEVLQMLEALRSAASVQ
ncbi:megakaryocyte stimulating factor [Trypanosoma cruzi]|nr:megakaryocyte stimulating factor [Trypanosoma cruzi]